MNPYFTSKNCRLLYSRLPGLSLILICIVLLANILVSVQALECDNSLQTSDDAMSYRLRSGRCEGVYVSTVSARSLELVSLTMGKIDYSLDSTAPPNYQHSSNVG